MTTRTKTSRQRSLRRLAYVPLIMAVAAGALCTGTAISVADTTAPATSSDPVYTWSLINHTGQPIYGEWRAEISTGDHSIVHTDADHPWKPGDVPSAFMGFGGFHPTMWKGRICYDKHWWDYGPESLGQLLNPTLAADSTGMLWVYPHGDGISWRLPMYPENSVCIY
ncbi:hypothetical protein R3Q06_27510 [Rhodococcus erythropolis]|uniref:hypothetical protein n=1 Tax=Rhodococcus erythropolis TaxID=1833 RepID=UPI002949BA0D|nr:hypothetical protein [Rhodococcus erythropolis]MDV6277248.1 hypothetical protein [Rhodococcus erythropolis]